MENWQKARKELQNNIENYPIGDEVYSLAHEIIMKKVLEIEKKYQLEDKEEVYNDDGEMWFDEIREDLLYTIYNKIEEWLTNI